MVRDLDNANEMLFGEHEEVQQEMDINISLKEICLTGGSEEDLILNEVLALKEFLENRYPENKI